MKEALIIGVTGQDGSCLVAFLLGDSAGARDKLGWGLRVSFEDLSAEMVREDLKSAERDEIVKRRVTLRIAATSRR